MMFSAVARSELMSDHGTFSERASRLLKDGGTVTVRDLWALAENDDERMSDAFTWANLRLCWAMKVDTPEYKEARHCLRYRTL